MNFPYRRPGKHLDAVLLSILFKCRGETRLLFVESKWLARVSTAIAINVQFRATEPMVRYFDFTPRIMDNNRTINCSHMFSSCLTAVRLIPLANSAAALLLRVEPIQFHAAQRRRLLGACLALRDRLVWSRA